MKTNTVMNKKLLALAISASLMTLSAGAYAADHFISIDGTAADGNYNNDAAAAGTKNIVIGSSTVISPGTNNILIGNGVKVKPGSSGNDANNSVAIGNGSAANQGSATSVGVEAESDGWGASAYGYKAQAKNTGAAAVGNWAVASGTYSTAIGTSSKAEGAYSISSGVSAVAKGNQSVALGLSSGADVDNGVALGAYSKATVDKGEAGYDPSGKNLTGAVWKATHAAVSVGSSDSSKLVTRQINNVAAGTADADAVNVAQLKALNAVNTEQLRTLEERLSTRHDSVLNHVREIESKIYDIGKKADASAASAIAQASIPQATKAGTAGIGIGTGVYSGQSAIAVGFSAVTPGENWVFKGSISSNSKGKFGAGAGALYQW
ncbi:YadA-like family protein [Neisseria sp. HMSC31F04]|uniref:YadA-like family protein n=1 Tax=Neisseria sp. HMSC31F04 TaxID=1581075 RepID=UPI0009F5FD48|nr:YadA-like family protein [Neisseria sp. HMSC31F04]